MKPTTKDIVLKLLKNIGISKTAGDDNLPETCLQDGTVILAKPVTEICNPSIKSDIFPDPCKLAKLKPIFQEWTLQFQTYFVTTFDFQGIPENCA